LTLLNFAAQARGRSSVVEHTILPDTDSPGVALTEKFEFQSYFDDTLLSTALLLQSQNEPIVGSTLKKANVGGYAFGLHPSSQAPVAVRPLVGGQGASPQAIILKPGQIYRPKGRPGGKPGHFSGFDWGLPFGWLGGGVCTLYVFPSPDADVAWPGDPELLFHRQRVKIVNAAGLPANAPKNWPLRFPWTQAIRGASSISQKGAAIISISNPTRIELSLRVASLAVANEIRFVIHESNDFDLDSVGAVIATLARFREYTFGTYAAAGGVGNLSIQYPVDEILGGPLNRLAADDGGIVIQDITGGLVDQYVDICRYGRI
jgi:hypothetical protein